MKYWPNRRRVNHRTTICRRKVDGKLFRPSHPGTPAFLGFWFREVEQNGRYWVDTGEVWAFYEYDLFDVVVKGK